MEQDVTTDAARAFGITESALTPMSGGHHNRVFAFTQDGADCVLRITPPGEDLEYQSLASIVEWMNVLAQHGAPVVKPLLSHHSRLIECIEDGNSRHLVTSFTKAAGMLAEDMPFEQWNDALFEQLGRAAGKLHAVATQYQPRDTSLRRPDWTTFSNCYNPLRQLDESESFVAVKRQAILSAVHQLPKDAGCYGLIHADFHCGNFFVDPSSKTITVFDFDDCCYGWFAMDIAMNLFDLAVLYPGAGKETFAREFMPPYLRGYTAEQPLSAFWLTQLPLLLKLLETGLYLHVAPGHNLTDHDSWVGRFMQDRKQRIENEVPYVNVNFLELGA